MEYLFAAVAGCVLGFVLLCMGFFSGVRYASFRVAYDLKRINDSLASQLRKDARADSTASAGNS